ncbi:MAG: hypothetical protein ACM359_09345 [Bacillota bacterium]
MVLRLFASAVLLFVAAACSGPKQGYMVDIKNISAVPLSVGLIKSDGSMEDGWTSPEQVAIHAPQLGERRWGTLVPSGQIRTIGPQSASFPGGGHGVLRIYAGDFTVDELIAFGKSDPGRMDIHLWPGQSGYIVDVQNGQLKVKPMDQDRIERPQPEQQR